MLSFKKAVFLSLVAGVVKSGVSNDNNAYPELDDYQYVNYAAQPQDHG